MPNIAQIGADGKQPLSNILIEHARPMDYVNMHLGRRRERPDL
jgi:hypothetical protein